MPVPHVRATAALPLFIERCAVFQSANDSRESPASVPLGSKHATKVRNFLCVANERLPRKSCIIGGFGKENLTTADGFGWMLALRLELTCGI